jgi:hypothetical protein
VESTVDGEARRFANAMCAVERILDKSQTGLQRLGFMSNRPPNALKHGAFAKMMILPWEDPQEFEKLHAGLVEEWKRVGPTEHDAVLSIAKGMWRKRRMQNFLFSELERHRADPNHAAYDEASALRVFSSTLHWHQTNSISPSPDLLLVLLSIFAESSRGGILNLLRNGSARSRMKSRRFCYRRWNVSASTGPVRY